MTISGFKNFRAALLYLTATLLTLFSIGCNDRGPTVHRKEVHNIHFKGKIYIYRWEKFKDKTTRVNVGIPQPDGRVEYTDDKTLEDEIQILAQQVLNGDSNNGTVTVNNAIPKRHAVSATSASVYLLDKVFFYQFDPVAVNVSKRLDLSAPPLTGAPVNFQVTNDGKLAVITNIAGTPATASYLLLVDLSTFIPVANIPVPFRIYLFGVAITPDNKFAYVLAESADSGACSVLVLDLVNFNVVATIALGPNDLDMNVIAMTPDGTEVYVASSVAGAMFSIPVIDVATNTVSTRISMQYFSKDAGLLSFTPGSYLAMHPDGSRLYMAPLDGSPVRVLDTATKTITKLITIPQGDHPWFGTAPVFTPDGKALFVLNAPNGIAIIETLTDTLLSVIDLDPSLVGQAPGAVRIGFSFVPAI